MIVNSNTVINPGAVMIKTLYTFVTDAAVTGALSPYYLAIGAEQYGVEIFQHGLY
jgi:cytochrome b